MKKIKLKKTKIKGLFSGDLTDFNDKRGTFFRFFCKNETKKFLKNNKIVQINLSKNKKKGTIRGLHLQKKPFAEKKIVICVRGEIEDFVVDLRKNSKTFLKIFKIKLSEKNKKILFIPEGMAHGFKTLKNNTDVLYFHTQFYKASHELSVNFKDPKIKIKIKINKKLISKKDLNIEFLDKRFKGFNYK